MPNTSSIFLFWWERQTDDYRPAVHDRFRWGNAATRAVDAEADASAVDSPRWFNFRDARRGQRLLLVLIKADLIISDGSR